MQCSDVVGYGVADELALFASGPFGRDGILAGLAIFIVCLCRESRLILYLIIVYLFIE